MGLDTIFIYHNDIYPNFSSLSNSSEISTQFSSLRRSSGDDHNRIFPHSRAIVPPTFSTFYRVWKHFIFPDSDIPIQINRPNHFTDLYDVLREYNFFFGFEQPESGINGPQRVLGQSLDIDVRYCIMLAAINTVFCLKNAILTRTNIFGKIDYISPTCHRNSDVSLCQINNTSPQKVLHLNVEIYRELDYFLLTRQTDEFWNRIIYISDQISARMIELTHDSQSLDFIFERVIRDCIASDHGDLKAKIIEKLRNKNVPESVLGALYDLILEHQMQLPNF